jgi:hypothetical protein
MGRRTDRLLVGGILVVLLCIGAISWVVLHLPADRREGVVKLVIVALGVLVAAVPLAEKAWRARRSADPRPVDTLVDLLAQGMHEQWRKTAAERMLVTLAPIRVRWSLSELSVAGPVTAAIGDPDVAPAFPPLSGQSRVTGEQLRAGGGRSELFAVYAGLASGRMVVIGHPAQARADPRCYSCWTL